MKTPKNKPTPIPTVAPIPSGGPIVLTPEEKARLRAFFASPEWRKLSDIVHHARPSSNCLKAGSGERDEFSDGRATARLGEMRGWDMHIVALGAAVIENVLPKAQVEPTYPDIGMLNIEPAT